MAKWYEIVKRVDHSKNGKRFYSSRDMMEIRRMESVANSELKRGLRKKDHTHIYECGCGTEGCFIIS